MDQNDNDNLFNVNNTPSEPQSSQPPAQEPDMFSIPSEPAPFEPTPAQQPPAGAQVYDIPTGAPASQTAYNAGGSFPPPPPPPAQPAKSKRTIWIVLIVAVLLLCCCCLVIAGLWLWNNGDQLLENIESLIPAFAAYLA